MLSRAIPSRILSTGRRPFRYQQTREKGSSPTSGRLSGRLSGRCVLLGRASNFIGNTQSIDKKWQRWFVLRAGTNQDGMSVRSMKYFFCRYKRRQGRQGTTHTGWADFKLQQAQRARTGGRSGRWCLACEVRSTKYSAQSTLCCVCAVLRTRVLRTCTYVPMYIGTCPHTPLLGGGQGLALPRPIPADLLTLVVQRPPTLLPSLRCRACDIVLAALQLAAAAS